MKNRLFLSLNLLLSLAISASLLAQQVVQFDEPETKQRYEYLLENLRCLVCQNQSLADSDAGLANDLRVEIEYMLRQGDSDRQVINFLVDRYGEFVLYDPPLKMSTYLLWFAPLLLLVAFAVSMISYFCRQRKNKSKPDLDDERRARATDLLRDKQ